MHNTPENTSKSKTAVKKAFGTLAKVEQMIEEDKYCPDIIQQVDATIGLLQAARKSLLAGHLDHCLPIKMKEDKSKTITELLKIYNLNK